MNERLRWGVITHEKKKEIRVVGHGVLVELGRKEHQEALPTRVYRLEEGLAGLIARAVRIKGPLALLLHLRLGQQLRQAPAHHLLTDPLHGYSLDRGLLCHPRLLLRLAIH